MTDAFTMTAPGRICLFGEHQDYLGLGVIAAGIDRCMRIAGRRDQNIPGLLLELPDLGETEEFDPADPGPCRHQRDYLRSALHVLAREGLKVPAGWRFRLTSNIPINAGCGSSSVMCLCWIAALLKAGGLFTNFNQQQLALLANQAEVGEFGESGGVMDHMAAAFGGLFTLDCQPPWPRKKLAAKLPGLVLISPGEAKETTDVIKSARSRAIEAITRAKEIKPGFDLRQDDVGIALQVALKLPAEHQAALRCHIQGRMLFRQQLENLSRPEPDLGSLGAALDEHHQALAHGLGLSTPRIDQALACAKKAGALGGKLNGSGGGGTCFTLAPGHQGEVIQALAEIGIKGQAVNLAPGIGES